MRKYRSRWGPNLTTIQRLKDLAEYRELHRDKWGKPPSWTGACRALRMNYRTLKRHAPDLFEKWNDPDFHW